jgi:hypothetical protein
VLLYPSENRLSFIFVSYSCEAALVIFVGYMYPETDGQPRTGQLESLGCSLLTLMHLVSGLDAVLIPQWWYVRLCRSKAPIMVWRAEGLCALLSFILGSRR